MATAAMQPVAIGIDLGTTFTCMGVFIDGAVQILTNKEGKKTTPSYVAFTDERRLIGEFAKQYANSFPEQVLYDSKRLMGRKFRDETVQKDKLVWPFEVVNVEGKPKMQVKYKTVLQSYHPEEVSAMVLQEMKEVAEKFLGYPVKEAVITVPAYFTDAQKRATKNAGEIAGLKVLGIIHEPTAAALAYGFDNQDAGEHKILVYDFGGGTFDVSLLSVEEGRLHVISTGGDSHLGGQDIDNLLVKHLARDFQRINGLELTRTSKAIRRLRTACERAKIELSTQCNSKIELDLLLSDKDLNFNMTRAWFEDVCEDMFDKTLGIVKDVLARGKVDKSEISDIILVGGSTRIPNVKDMLKNFFNGKEPRTDINPDEAVAYGAAIQAAIMCGVESRTMRSITLSDVTPLTLGIGTANGLMAIQIKRNTVIPATKRQVFTTSVDYQSHIHFEVYEGERPLIKDNILLGQFSLMGIPPAQRGVPRITVTFEMDKDGILKVSAVDPGTDNRKSLVITSRNSLSKEAIALAITTAKQMKKDDQLELNKIKSRNNLLNYAQKIRGTLGNDKMKEKISTEDQEKILDKLDDLNSLCHQQDEGVSLSDLDNLRNELEEMWNPIVKVWYPDFTPDSSRPALVDEELQLEFQEGENMMDSWYDVRLDGEESDI